MATKPVAVVGDVTAAPGTVLHTKTAAGSGSSSPSGSWSAGEITYTSYPALKSDGARVIWKAECTFSFTGTNTSGAAVNETEKVTLTAGTTVLDPGQHSVLVDGDQQRSTTYQNTLRVSAAGPLRSA